jgi:hypothetical protein
MPNMEYTRFRVTSENRTLLEALLNAFKEIEPKSGEWRYAPDYFKKALSLPEPSVKQHSRSWIDACEDERESVSIDASCAWSDWNCDNNADFIEWVTQGIYALDEDASIEIITELRVSYTKEGGKEYNP